VISVFRFQHRALAGQQQKVRTMRTNRGLTLPELIAILAILGIAVGVLGTLTSGLSSQAETNTYGGAYASLKDQVKANSRLTEGSGLYTTRWDWYLSQTKTAGKIGTGQAEGFARAALIPRSMRYWNTTVLEGQILYGLKP
jgi:hypothetical protein